ncbi:hypothetical protein CesoFtcFv8_012068 [Champsocephalus esox]|uniref:Uncharacterized protein n=1 Tax=Champsocephalus esox TaxID=159716 RepID=A0AAN8GYD0_9TELE|nr:hypothetical protein CesoFtcFv8_012068 [Champsocephalus esox]
MQCGGSVQSAEPAGPSGGLLPAHPPSPAALPSPSSSSLPSSSSSPPLLPPLSPSLLSPVPVRRMRVEVSPSTTSSLLLGP